ncbi:MAG: oligopeptide/dipeptide ABC transporter ATP-binding protein [Pseudomonadota bacterium]
MSGTSILEVAGLTKDFKLRGKRRLRAVDDVDFSLGAGETLGVVGESGCGKTTLGRLVLGLIAPTSGTIAFEGRFISGLSEPEMRPLRRHIQVVFQDPYSSLNPRLTVRNVIAEPLENYGFRHRAIEERVAEVLRIVGLPLDAASRYPHAFSGGQRQRICIARALALNPKLIICDEAVSALDVSVQAQILNLLAQLREELGLSLLFISHNLAVVRYLSHRIAVMYLGRIVELADTETLFATPQHPYTAALLKAVPEPDPSRRAAPPPVEGDIPSPIDPPPGCVFHPRCSRARSRCRSEVPALAEAVHGGTVRCFFPVGVPT